MRRLSNVSFRSHIGQDVADHAKTSARRRNWYVNETDLFKTSLWRLIGTYKKPTNLRRQGRGTNWYLSKTDQLNSRRDVTTGA